MEERRFCQFLVVLTDSRVAEAALDVVDMMADHEYDPEHDAYGPEDAPWIRYDGITPTHFCVPNGKAVPDMIERLESDSAEEGRCMLARRLRAFINQPDEGMRRERGLRGAHETLIRKGVFRGIDLRVLAERFWRMESMRVDERCGVPEIKFRACRGTGAWGRAHVAFRWISFSIGAGGTTAIENVAEVLLHELVHCACPLREHHGELFCRRLIAAAREAFGLDLDTAALLDLSPGEHGKRAYAIDAEIVKAMRAAGVGEKLREDPAARFEAPPEQTAEEVARRRAKAAEERSREREEHARAKLAEWERRAAAARRIASKWRGKVRYYERRQQAAKARVKP